MRWLTFFLQYADPAFAPIQDDPKLPRVLLIGDSISIGYTVPVREALRGKANVHRIPADGGTTADGVKNLDTWLGTDKWDVIHFNWGTQDLKRVTGVQQVPIEQYEKNLRELVRRLKATNAKLIWFPSMPLSQSRRLKQYFPNDIRPYNDAADKIMKENQLQPEPTGVISLKGGFHSDGVRLTRLSLENVTEQIVRSIIH